MKKPILINWARFWKKFDQWYDRNQWRLKDDWEDQKKKIQRLVEKEIKIEK